MSKDTGKVSIIWGESQIEKISTHPRHKKCPACVPDQNIDFSEDKPHVTGRNTQGNFTGAQTASFSFTSPILKIGSNIETKQNKK